ncbi:hypothetical protein RO865_17150 [Blautia faecis]|uniref:DUF6783 domain-containing protein n=1 Tax=unclassified Ruminococcus TaxID=2608920 RepID=UPI00280B4747|nr:DUF6783 domain-containing protein [Blautia faecis]MDT4370506.1 hypothetical protein [Blautia faecis]MEE0742777.1 DUF6783 domain-containing protein [Blautia faecis]
MSKNHSRNLHAPLCGRFCPNSVAVARYSSLTISETHAALEPFLIYSMFKWQSEYF